MANEEAGGTRRRALLWVIGPYVALSALAGLGNGIRYVRESQYLEQGLRHLAAAHVWDQVSRDVFFALGLAAFLAVTVAIAGRNSRVIGWLLPHVFLLEAGALFSRFFFYRAWSVNMPAFGIPLPGFLWRRQVILATGGVVLAAMLIVLLLQVFGPLRWRRWREGGFTGRVPVVAFGFALLVTGGAALLPRLAPAATPKNPVPIIWITWDSVRADRTSAYGYERPTTPNLERLAADGVLFETAVSQHNWTRPSYSSMFTSRGVWEFPNSLLNLSQVTLAELLSEHGYETIGYVQNPNLDAELNMAQGFASYNQLPGSTNPHTMNRFALPHLERALAGGKPVFLFLHYQQAHYPYHYDNPFRGEFAHSTREVMGEQETSRVMFGHGQGWKPGAPDAEEKLLYLKDSYAAAIRYADDGLGEAIERLKQLGLYGRCLLIVNADHGDEFHEHGSFGHAHRNLHPELVHVPLVIRFPDGTGPGVARVSALVESWDLFPTVLKVAGIPIPEGISGRSLLPLPGADAGDGLAISSVNDLVALRTGRHSLHADFSKGRSLRFYDLEADPTEQSPIFDAESYPDFGKMLSVAELWREQYRGVHAGAAPGLSKELLERLRSLGYVQ